jgi:hypothetical protein
MARSLQLRVHRRFYYRHALRHICTGCLLLATNPNPAVPVPRAPPRRSSPPISCSCAARRGENVFIKLAFAYEATTRCSRTDRKPRSAHVTVLSALDSALAATAPPAPPPPPWGCVCPEGGIGLIGPFRFLSRFMLLLPCLPLICSLAVLLCEGRRSWRRPNDTQSATSNCNTHMTGNSGAPLEHLVHPAVCKTRVVQQSSASRLGTYFFSQMGPRWAGSGSEPWGSQPTPWPTAAPGGAGREGGALHRPY